MSNGKLRTLDEFGWASSQSASVQRANVQAALDSGENLQLPCRETIQIDAGLVKNYPGLVQGSGADTAAGGTGATMIRCAVPNVQMLTVKPTAHNSFISGIHFQGDILGSGVGLVLGDGTTDHLRGVVVERVSTNPYLFFGIHVLAAGGMVIDKSWLWGYDSAIRLENRLQADTGDNKITNCDINGFSPTSAGIKWTSGGGLYVTGSKFVNGLNHIYVDWSLGGSGNFNLTGCSLESNLGISVDLRGSYDFKRMQIVGNTWGGIPSVAVAARGCPTNWLKDLLITGNTFDCYGATPILDLASTDNAHVAGNTFRGNGVATPGIICRSGTGGIGTNKFTGCTQAIQNLAGWYTTGQF